MGRALALGPSWETSTVWRRELRRPGADGAPAMAAVLFIHGTAALRWRSQASRCWLGSV